MLLSCRPPNTAIRVEWRSYIKELNIAQVEAQLPLDTAIHDQKTTRTCMLPSTTYRWRHSWWQQPSIVRKSVDSSQSRPTLGRKAADWESSGNRTRSRYPVVYQGRYSRTSITDTHEESLGRGIAVPINDEWLRGFHVIIGRRHFGVVQECVCNDESR